jgi:hypothetical protein
MPRGNEGMLGASADPVMQQAIQQAQPQSTPDLQDLTFFNNRSMGGVDEAEMNSERSQNMLTNLKKFDPNAQYVATYGGEGNLTGYTLNFDASKLPGPSGGQLGQGGAGMSGVGSGNTFMPRFSTVQDKMSLINPGAVHNSSHYGHITDNRNLMNKPGWLDWAGPMLVGGFGGLLGGGGALASLLQKAPGIINSAMNGQFNPMNLASAGLGFMPGVPPFMQTLSRLGLNAYNMTRGRK